MKLRTVIFYTKGDHKPIEEWLDKLDDARAEAIMIDLKFFEEYPNPIVPKKFFEKIKGTELWEIKFHYGKDQYRLLTFQEKNAVVVAVHGFFKKQWDIPGREIKVADTRRMDFLNRKNSNLTD